MGSFTVALALALAIAFTSFGSTRAAPAFANNNACQNKCKDGEYCNEKLGSPSCTACFNCADHNREAGPGSCAKSLAECGGEIPDIYGTSDYDDTEGGNPENRTALAPDVRVMGGVPGKPPAGKPDPPPDKGVDDDLPSVQPTNHVMILLASAGILAVIVVAVVCTLGRRPWDQGGWQWPKRPRSREAASAHFHRNVPEGDDLDLAGIDEDAEFYDRSDRQAAQNEGQAELMRLLDEALHPPLVAPPEVQQPPGHNRLNEESRRLDPHGALALPPSNIQEREHAVDVEVVINMNDAPDAAEGEQEDDDDLGIFPEFEAHSDDEPQSGNENDEDPAGNANEFGNDSGVSDNDKDDGMEGDVPQPPSSPAIQDNPIALISNNHPHLLQTLNQRQFQIANRAQNEVNMNLQNLPDSIMRRNPE